MWTESEIQNLKTIFLDEMSCYDQAEKVFDEWFEKLGKIVFSGNEELIRKLFETIKMPDEFLQFLEDSLDNGASPEECFKNAVRFGKEFYRIEEKAH